MPVVYSSPVILNERRADVFVPRLLLKARLRGIKRITNCFVCLKGDMKFFIIAACWFLLVGCKDEVRMENISRR